MRSGRFKKPPTLVAPGWAVEFTVPTIVVSEANERGHWAVRFRRFKAQETALATVMQWSLVSVQTSQGVPLLLTFTRLGGKRLDQDNCAGAFKACVDFVCRKIGRDDGDPALTFRYEQEVGGLQGIRVRVESKP